MPRRGVKFTPDAADRIVSVVHRVEASPHDLVKWRRRPQRTPAFFSRVDFGLVVKRDVVTILTGDARYGHLIHSTSETDVTITADGQWVWIDVAIPGGIPTIGGPNTTLPDSSTDGTNIVFPKYKFRHDIVSKATWVERYGHIGTIIIPGVFGPSP